MMELAETVWFGLRRKAFALSSRSSDKRARKAACGRIVGPADVSRVSGKSRTGERSSCNRKAATLSQKNNRGEVKIWQL